MNKIRVQAVYFTDEGINIDWMDEAEQIPQGGLAHQSFIGERAEQEWEQVAYYANELRQDAEELLHWFNKHRRGEQIS